jgi:two-component system response regulator BaeR
MSEAHILVVEDEDKIAGVLCDYLLHAGYVVHRLARGDEVEPWLAGNRADLVLLDLMLPGRDGLDVCRALRKAAATKDISIILVTARVEEIDRLLGLDAGADDYICKPFGPREVVARVRAVLRRSRSAPEPDGLTIDMAAGRALLDGRDLGLTVVELRLLSVLAAHPGHILSRDQLMSTMYPDEREVVDRTVDSHVKKLRRKIEAVRPDSEAVHSIYGMGYRYELQSRSGRS